LTEEPESGGKSFVLKRLGRVEESNTEGSWMCKYAASYCCKEFE